MKHCLKTVFTLAAFALIATGSVYAETEMVIALKTDKFELTETDISTLAIGEARTIETDSGSVIDILRTADGADIYVDGELLEMDLDHEGVHGEHMIQKHVEVICEDDEDCDENIIIHKEIEISCTDDEEGASCSDKNIWISEGEDFDPEELHEKHKGEETHKVIVIKKEINPED